MNENPLRIKTYDNPADFVREVSPQLRGAAAMNNLILGLAERFCKDATGCLYLSAAWQGDAMVGATMLSSPPHFKEPIANLIVSEAEEATVSALAADAWAAHQQRSLVFTGIVGEVATTNLYSAALAREGVRCTAEMEQGIYRCRGVKMPSMDEALTLRQATDADRELLGQWVTDYFAEALPDEPPRDGQPHADARIEGGNLWLAVPESGGEPVAMACANRNIGTSCTVNMVYTPKDLRRRGYGSYVTAQLTQRLLDGGLQETHLYTDLGNPTSNGIYQAIGYERVGSSRQLRIHAG